MEYLQPQEVLSLVKAKAHARIRLHLSEVLKQLSMYLHFISFRKPLLFFKNLQVLIKRRGV